MLLHSKVAFSPCSYVRLLETSVRLACGETIELGLGQKIRIFIGALEKVIWDPDCMRFSVQVRFILYAYIEL